MNLLVVLNPRARSGRAGRLREDIRAAFAQHAITADIRVTRAPGAAVDLVAGLEPGRYDAVVAGGGDGTLFEVLNGLYRLDRNDRAPLGLLPLGTGNAFARELGLQPFDWPAAIELIARGESRLIDVGHVRTADDSFYFLNIVGWGFVVDAGRAAARFKFAGNAAYTLGVLSALVRLRTHRLRIELDGEVIEQESLLTEVSNSRYTGTHFLMAPSAELDDGWLDVTLVRRLSRRRLLRLFPTIFDGRHVDEPEVTTRRARHIRVIHPDGLPLMPDGEFRGRTPLEITCLERDLEVLCRAGFSAPCS